MNLYILNLKEANNQSDYSGFEEWIKVEDIHRNNGPAVIKPNGEQQWHNNDKCHREDRPALIYANGKKRYFLEDEEIIKSEYPSALKKFLHKKNK